MSVLDDEQARAWLDRVVAADDPGQVGEALRAGRPPEVLAAAEVVAAALAQPLPGEDALVEFAGRHRELAREAPEAYKAIGRVPAEDPDVESLRRRLLATT